MKEDGAYAIAGAFLISAIILSAAIIYAVGNLNGSLQQVQKGISEVKVALANAPVATAAPPRAQATATPLPTQPPAPAPTGKISLDTGAAEGSEDAKFVIAEYSDFQCPFCQRFFSQTYGQLKENYVDNGKVRFIYKHFPLDGLHPQARPAARASECAKDQGKFFEYHDKLFAGGALDDASLKQYAKDVGLDVAKFDACYAKGTEKDAIIDAQMAEGAQNGIRGTPGFLITDDTGKVLQLVSGAQPYANFQAALSAAGVS